MSALVPKAELDGEVGAHHVGAQARLMSQAMRKLTTSLSQSPAYLIFINQIRHKIGVMFGSPETTSGGQALKFYSSVRLDIRRTGSIKKGDEIVGNSVRVKVVKNKLAPPFRLAEFDIEFGKGIARSGEVVDLATKHKILAKAGSWYSYEGKQVGQGREKVKAALEADPEMAARIEKELWARITRGADGEEGDAVGEDAGKAIVEEEK